MKNGGKPNRIKIFFVEHVPSQSFTNKLRQIYNLSIFSQKKKKKEKNNLVFLQAIEPI